MNFLEFPQQIIHFPEKTQEKPPGKLQENCSRKTVGKLLASSGLASKTSPFFLGKLLASWGLASRVFQEKFRKTVSQVEVSLKTSPRQVQENFRKTVGKLLASWGLASKVFQEKFRKTVSQVGVSLKKKHQEKLRKSQEE